METIILHTNLQGILSHDDLQQVEQLVTLGRVISFPTDTVYGLGVNLSNDDFIKQLYSIKERDHLKSIPVLVADKKQVELVAYNINSVALRIMDAFWPGAITLILPKNPNLPSSISTTKYIGVRMPDHPLALQVLHTTGPLAVTSANLSNHGDACSADEVLHQIGGRFSLLIDGGKTPGTVSSTVVDCTNSDVHILRQGPITIQQINDALTG